MRHHHFISQEGDGRWGRVVPLTIGPTSRLGLACPHRYKTKTHTHTHTHTVVDVKMSKLMESKAV